MTKQFKLILVTVLILTTMACDQFFATPIRKIIENPRDYDGKQVTISGEVTEVFSFFVIKYFMVRDGTGELAVVTNKPLPKTGTQIKVRGVVKEAFAIADKQLLVLYERDQ